MADERIRVPSARLAVSLLDDEDALTLMHRGKVGIYALWAFTGLLILAKTLKNKGRFRAPMSKYARRIGLTPIQLDEAISEIRSAAAENEHEPWIVQEGDYYVIRSWATWNATGGGWGGHRPGSGRKGSNQDEIKMISRLDQDGCPSVSVSVSDSGTGAGKDPDQPTHSARITHPAPHVAASGGDAQGESGWTGTSEGPFTLATTRRLDVLDWLELRGIGPPVAQELAEAGLAVADAQRTWDAVQADHGAANKHAVFIARTRKRLGIAGRKDGMPQGDADAVSALQRIRRRRSATR